MARDAETLSEEAEPLDSGGERRDPPTRSKRGSGRRRPSLAIAAAAGLAAAIGITLAAGWLLAADDGDEPAPAAERAPAAAVSIRRLNEFAGSADHPVYWAGAQPSFAYELTRTDDGRVYIRYLPPGTKVGDPRPNFLTVGTYPQEDALGTLRATAEKQGVETIELPGGGLAFQDKSRPTSVYVAYPGSDYQVEVYAPSPELAHTLVSRGQIKPLGAPPPVPAGAKEVTVDELKQLADTLDHPLYWAGEEPETTYELTTTTDGSVYVRYLPAGVAIGVRRPDYLTIGTYRLENALETLRETAQANDVDTIELDGGGLAFVDVKRPTSVYVAYPDSDVQIEVYDPSPTRARKLVTSRRVVPLG